MKNIFKSLALVLAIVLAMTLSLSVLAEDSSDVATESVVESAAESVAESATESATESSSDASSEASSEASAVTESSSTTTTGSTDSTNKSEPQETAKNFPWARVITLIVIVVLCVVAWVLTKTETAIGQKIKKFFKEYWSEIKKISWSSPKDTAKATGIVLVFLIVSAVAIGVLDLAFTKIIQLIAEIFN
ncbi:MAG: preprotein translocase subunit SecE [Clostridia bacterium]|nr:preprotein translocase subunit SecE [Clostridia bacterium]